MRLKKLLSATLCGIFYLSSIGYVIPINAQEDIYYDNCNTSEELEEKDFIVGHESTKKIKSENVYSADGILLNEFCYDIYGNDTKYAIYNDDGSLYYQYTYENDYDSDGNIIKREIFNTYGDLTASIVFEYDSKGNEIKQINFKEDGSGNGWTDFLYDNKGNKIKETVYNKDETISYSASSEWEYDSDGNLTKSLSFKDDGSIDYMNSKGYEYDSKGNMIKSFWYDSDGTNNGAYHIFEYDSYGNLIKDTWYSKDDSIFSYTEFEYDSKGNEVKSKTYNSDGSLDWWIEYEYDSYGNKTKSTQYNSDGSVTTNENKYEYDSDGDIIAIIYPDGGTIKYEYYSSKDDTKSDKESTSNPEPIGVKYSTYESNDFYRDEAGDTRCYDSTGAPVINEFKCDGTYTYYFQLDGTAMKDRLSYHPDGEHVIYFDAEGHEVFSDIANVKKTIAGEDVNDFCFFNVFGYMYVDVLTYDKTGTYLYYANPYGVMEMGKWFQFSDSVEWADGTPAEGIAGGYGYANENGTLLTNTQTVDWEGRSCYLQGNGVALY
ncbi:MAG: hypothetical protein IJ141_04840 [Lachnospiraceae bacterium]|nr:hypothetical protein [Lachnospiraceae bacterium]